VFDKFIEAIQVLARNTRGPIKQEVLKECRDGCAV